MHAQPRRSSSFFPLAFAASVLVCALTSLIALVGFLSNTLLAKTIDSGPMSVTAPAWIVDVFLVVLFGLQHSLMARSSFKSWASRFVPHAFERSAYILASALAIGALIVGWRPLPANIWDLDSPSLRAILWSLFALGWLTMIASTLELDALEFSGLRQAATADVNAPPRAPTLRVRGLHRLVRHPTYSGWLLVAWSTPSMSVGHLLFAALSSVYIGIAIVFEERDLVRVHGHAYTEYRRRVPSLVPWRLRVHARVEPWA